MLLPGAALIGGILLLVVSADRFVAGAAATARRLGLPPLLIGMVIIGFGSSMPEMVISALAALAGNPALAVGNALGSNIANIGLILGVTALISPIPVRSSVIVSELPMLTALTVILGVLIFLGSDVSRAEGVGLILVFAGIMAWSIYTGMSRKGSTDEFAHMVEQEYAEPMRLGVAIGWLVFGLVLLVVSSRILVWGGIEIARMLGVSDLIIGLTVVAVGTSLPELASSIAAVRKNEHELALGNVIGSNLFNTSIVLGIAAIISPPTLEPAVLLRDFPVLMVLTLVLFVMGYWFRGPGTGRINRLEGGALLLGYIGYTSLLAFQALS